MTTIPTVLQNAVKRWPGRDAIVDGEQRLSFTALEARVIEAAKGMVAAGLEKGDTFAIWAPNIADWIVAALAGQYAGGVLVTLNTRYKGGEAADILRRSKCKLLFTVNGFLGVDYAKMLKGEHLPDLEKTIILSGNAGPDISFKEFCTNGQSIEQAEIRKRIDALSDDDIADIIFTSGTTGAPKGAMASHGQNVEVFENFVSAIGLNDQDRYLIINPFFHSFGYKAGWLSCLISGAAIYPAATFDTNEIAALVEKHKITALPGPPTIFQTMQEMPEARRQKLKSLRIATTGAAVIPVDLVRRMKEDLHFDEVFTAYGLTESTGVVSLCRKGDDFETIAKTCGRPMDGIEVKLVDDDGVAVVAGDEGEIWVRGFNVMKGYLDDPAATAETITSDGWLKTGDIGVQDERGYIKITDRKKDMFIVGGFNCYPAEIEKALFLHDEVRDVAVVGKPDERMGEVAHAYIVPANAATFDEKSFLEWARGAIANYKVPRGVTLMEEFPRNASGKVQKFLLPEA